VGKVYRGRCWLTRTSKVVTPGSGVPEEGTDGTFGRPISKLFISGRVSKAACSIEVKPSEPDPRQEAQLHSCARG